MQQDESDYHFIHAIYEIERSPLGCIFGSYIYMSKGFKYTFRENCTDVAEELKESDKEISAAAKYIA